MRQAFHSIKARASASTIAPDGGFRFGAGSGVRAGVQHFLTIFSLRQDGGRAVSS